MSNYPIDVPGSTPREICWDYDPRSLDTSPPVHRTAVHGNTTMTKKKEKMEMPVCARVSLSKFRTLEIWCDNSFRKRSEVVGLLLERVLEMVEQHASIEQPVEEFVRRLRADRPD